MEVERIGLPTASLVCAGFVRQGNLTAQGLGMGSLPMAVYPGHIDLDSIEEIQRNIESVIVEQVVRCLTVKPPEAGLPVTREPEPEDIVARGTFEEVNRTFYASEWGDGLPVVPPTVGKVEEFLRFTERPAHEVIGVLLPDEREATPWNIAANGVMAGCRPEYMPVLVALVEAMADPAFGHPSLGHTPGAEVQITLNGPIIKELGFNYEQGALRVGYEANTSIGRFWRLYLRNVAGFLPHKTDKATFGGTWRVVAAENEDALAGIGWEPMSVDQGFKAGDNVVTISTCTASWLETAGASTAERILDRIATRIVDIQLCMFGLNLRGQSVRPQIMLSPCLAGAIAKGGYSKARAKEYLHKQARFPAKRCEDWDGRDLCSFADQGFLPGEFCQSTDPERLVPIVFTPQDFMITVTGDPGRDNCLILCQNGFIGYPVSRKIELPAAWEQLKSDCFAPRRVSE
ncbi:MAG: hypothetical protein HYY32_06500 [Chloroflexi bacterium]|nr:hypothetical protein [Chloroflexota bacterium]